MALLRDFPLFCGALFGLAFPVWRCLGPRYEGPERFSLALAAGLVAGALAIFALYIAGLPLVWFWLFPVLGLTAAAFDCSGLAVLRRDAATGWLVAHWMVLSIWCVGWHGLVVSYSGASWSGDWLEHYDRAHFFLQRWRADHLFLDFYPLPARPPLANLWTAGLLSLGGSFTHYQIFTTLLSCLVIFPLGLLLRRWCPGRTALSLLLGVLMLNPLLVQNATFPWTKLATAFFVLLAVNQLWPTGTRPPLHRLVSGGLLLSAAMLTHYSAGPWILGLGAGLLFCHRHCIRERFWWRHLAIAAAAASLLFLPWLIWSLAVYGPFTTFAGNTAVVLAPGGTVGQRLATAAANVWSTLSPIPADSGIPRLQQTSPWGQWRDAWFLLYQLKLPYACGLAGSILMAWHLLHLRRSPVTDFWLVTTSVVVVLAPAVHAAPDRFGLVHIALQPLVLLALVWFVAKASSLPVWLRRSWGLIVTLDFGLGILGHFAVQAFWFDRWANPGATWGTYLASYPWPAQANGQAKHSLGLTYLADTVPSAVWIGLLFVGATLTLVLLRTPEKHHEYL